MTQDIKNQQIKAMSYLIGSDDNFAIRALPVAERAAVPERIFSGKNIEQAMQWANGKDNANYKGVYFTINPTVATIPEREDGRREQVKDQHIITRQILYIDIDAIKHPADGINPVKVCSTPDELAKTQELAQEIIAYIKSEGIEQEPLIVNSGNGTHIFYKIDMANDEASHNLIADFLKSLGDKFTGEKGDVDVKIKNAARICRLVGTTNRKGEDGIEEGRNHRVAYVAQFPQVNSETWRANPISAEKLEQIAAYGRIAKVEKVRKAAADRKAKSRGGRKTDYAPRKESKTQEKVMTATFINRADFIVNHVNQWIGKAYEATQAPDDRNDWLGFLSAIKEIFGESGWADFDAWCQVSAHYDANGNRQSWDAPARTEGYASECLKLAASFAKIGFDIDAVADELGFVLSREKIMSIQEIKDAIASDNNLTARWTWSANKGVWYPCAVWEKNWQTRRLESFDDSDRGKAFMSVLIGTEVIHGKLEPVFPVQLDTNKKLIVYNELTKTWDTPSSSDLNNLISRHNGFAIVGRNKDGGFKRLVARDTNYEANAMARLCPEISLGNSNILPLRDAKLTWRRGAKGYNIEDLRASDYVLTTLPFSLSDCKSSPTPRYDAVLNRLFEGDAERVECFLQWQGAVLFSATTTMQLPMLLLTSEQGGTGKSMLLNILERLVGRENASSSPLEDLKDRGVLVSLTGKKINIDFDMDLSTVMDNVSVLKTLVTGEAVKRRVVGSKDTVEFRYGGAMVAAANGTPTFKRYDAGLDRRLLVVPTTNEMLTAREKIFGYDEDIFNEEGAGIIQKSLDAFQRMLDIGEFVIPQVCQDAKAEMRNNIDSLAEYLSENWEVAEGAKAVKIKDIYNEYVTWCAMNRVHAMSGRRFSVEAKIKLEMSGAKITRPQDSLAANIQPRVVEREIFGFRK